MKREFVEIVYTIDGVTKTGHVRKNKLHNIRESMNQALTCGKCQKPHGDCWCPEAERSLKETHKLFKKVCKEHKVHPKTINVYRSAIKCDDITVVYDYMDVHVDDELTLDTCKELVQEIDRAYEKEIAKMDTDSLERYIKTAKQNGRHKSAANVVLSEITERVLLKDDDEENN